MSLFTVAGKRRVGHLCVPFYLILWDFQNPLKDVDSRVFTNVTEGRVDGRKEGMTDGSVTI
jgi:hypothetical protein